LNLDVSQRAVNASYMDRDPGCRTQKYTATTTLKTESRLWLVNGTMVQRSDFLANASTRMRTAVQFLGTARYSSNNSRRWQRPCGARKESREDSGVQVQQEIQQQGIAMVEAKFVRAMMGTEARQTDRDTDYIRRPSPMARNFCCSWLTRCTIMSSWGRVIGQQECNTPA
jgi:hypothetical protein